MEQETSVPHTQGPPEVSTVTPVSTVNDSLDDLPATLGTLSTVSHVLSAEPCVAKAELLECTLTIPEDASQLEQAVTSTAVPLFLSSCKDTVEGSSQLSAETEYHSFEELQHATLESVIAKTQEAETSDSSLSQLSSSHDINNASQAASCTLVEWTSNAPSLVAFAEKEYLWPKKANNYLRGCVWSPDGSCILTNSNDNVLRIFNLPSAAWNDFDKEDAKLEEMTAVLRMRETEPVYDCMWYPAMNSEDPLTCCFASTSRRSPIRLWDAFTGEIRASYIPFNHLGEMIAAYSIAFSGDCQRLYAGFSRCIRVFDVTRPGSESERRPRLGRKAVQGSIISCLATPRTPDQDVYASGSYNGSVCVFVEPGTLIARLTGLGRGITQLAFSPEPMDSGAPWYLAAGGRMDSRIIVWDARNLGIPLFVLHRRVENQQRIHFDFDATGRYLFTGSQTGAVCAYDFVTGTETHSSNAPEHIKPAAAWRAHNDCAHGLSVHPALPLLATTSGQRHVHLPRRSSTALSDSSSEEEFEAKPCQLSNDEASVVPYPHDFTDHDSGEAIDCGVPMETLPCVGRLDLLPVENRLCLWRFPTVVNDYSTDQDINMDINCI